MSCSLTSGSPAREACALNLREKTCGCTGDPSGSVTMTPAVSSQPDPIK